VILVDGCPMQCGKKVLENCQVEPFRYFMVTDLGIRKEDSVGDLEAGVRTITDHVLSNI